MGGWHGMGWDGMGWGGMGWGWLFVVVLVIGVVLLVMALVRRWNGPREEPRGAGRSRAHEILDERYARGEIDTAEYQDRLQQLRTRE